MSTLDELADRLFRLVNERDPIAGAQNGQEWCEALLPDLSEAQQQRWAADVEDQLAELARCTPANDDERMTAALLAAELEAQRADIGARWAEFTVDATFVGPSVQLLTGVPKVDLPTPGHLERYLARCAAIPGYLAQAEQRLRDGRERGRTPTACGIRASIAQLDSYLLSAPSSDLFVHEPTFGAAVDGQARERIAAVVAERVRPALQRYRDALAEEFLPISRDDDRVGLVHLPDGPTTYAAALRRHSGTDLTAAEIHRIGLDAIATLTAEVVGIAPLLLGVDDPRAAFAIARERADLRFDSVEQMIAHCQAALDRADAALPTITGIRPAVGCRIETMTESESAVGAVGYYQPPAPASGRPGVYWLNVRSPRQRPRYEYEALTFHESVPGHHVQTAVAQELTGLPDFRRFGYLVPYCEGWALYTERLCDELGLYSSDLDRLGMLSFALWRACRLVVDTGLHDQGWSRSQAIDFLHGHTGLAMANVVNEVDRYIAWPGQATGYYLGYERIMALRAAARRRPGFDLRDFHTRFLELGPMPFEVLERVLAR